MSYRSRFVHHILCVSPFISRDFFSIRPLILWHILGPYFLLIWGVGVVRIIFKFWGRISRGHPRGYPGGRPGAKASVRPSKSWKNKHFGADIHDPKARDVHDLRGV